MNRIARIGVAIAAAVTLGVIGVSSASGTAPHDPPAPGPASPTPDQLGAQSQALNLENLYVSIVPCRIVDTRAGTGTDGTPISRSVRTYYVGGTQLFVPQGGKSGGCGIPVGAVAIAATITAVSPQHGGYIRAWPNGVTEPNATLLNYAGSSIGTGATVPISSTSAQALKVHNYGGPTNLVIDVAGYYLPQIYGTFASNGDLYNGTGRLNPYLHLGAGYYTLLADQDLTGCSVVGSSYASGYIVSTYALGQYVYVEMRTTTNALIDYYFQVHVDC